MFTCERTDERGRTEVRNFANYTEAYAFCLREGEHSRLWSIDDRIAELLAEIEEYGSAEAMGRLDAHKHMANPDPCGWELGLSLSEQSDRVHEYLRGYEDEQRFARRAAPAIIKHEAA